MEKEKIINKFNGEYQVDDETFIMGIHYLLGGHIAQRFKGFGTVLDACCGAGFMSIALAKYVNQIIAVEINPKNLEQAKNNIEIADISSKVKFILGDIFNKEILNDISQIDAAFLDPDWTIRGSDKHIHSSKISDMQPPADKLFYEISKLTQNIVLRLPREIKISELESFPHHELERIYLDDDFKFYCAYFGKLTRKKGNTEFRAFNKIGSNIVR